MTLITTLHGVGKQTRVYLNQLGIFSIEDMLLHLPIRYENRTCITSINQLVEGQTAIIEGIIQSSEVKHHQKGNRSFVCLLSDGTGAAIIRFFHFYSEQQRKLQPGVQMRCFGEVRSGNYGLEFVHPQYECYRFNKKGTDYHLLSLEDHLTPVYSTAGNLSQTLLRSLVNQAFGLYPPVDYLPPALSKEFALMPFGEALRFLHYPPAKAPLELLATWQHPAQRRIIFDELVAHYLSLYALRVKVNEQNALPLTNQGTLVSRFLAELPFKLTTAQQRVSQEIADDLCHSHPMQRLLQGDVGSGKTVVSALAALQAIESGYQVAVMTPTELLAEQHKHSFIHWLKPLGIQVAWLTGSLPKKARDETTQSIAAGQSQLIVGTHALFQENITFARLGLVIIDEQHRFGVHQRLALRNKGNQDGYYPHQLIMTATPIPRTLQMTAYCDLDVSVIDELPPGRTPITTSVFPNTRRDEVIDRLKIVCKKEGRQVYWVCTLIEESDILQCEAAEKTTRYLQQVLPHLNVGLIHGRMRSKEKDEIMAAFKNNTLDLLVATTVIEVGVDVPNASIMIIENAERLGLAQLHQLRGRVGRGAIQSFCILLYQEPLSEIALARLQAIRETNDGFIIAQRDLELRGPGELLGTRQTGMLNLRVANLQRDKALLDAVGQVSKKLLAEYPQCCRPLLDRWIKHQLDYGEV